MTNEQRQALSDTLRDVAKLLEESVKNTEKAIQRTLEYVQKYEKQEPPA
jgi:hypothetical protein